jgi:hypothetical protein
LTTKTPIKAEWLLDALMPLELLLISNSTLLLHQPKPLETALTPSLTAPKLLTKAQGLLAQDHQLWERLQSLKTQTALTTYNR